MEIIRFGVQNDKAPLLFVHGSYCGAWIWEKYFLPYFAEAGFWGAAISLRGHGKSEGALWINSYGVRDYLSDIEAGVKLFDKPCVLVGHSLGGYLIQKFALENPVAGLVLLSSPSLLGLGASAQHIAFNSPLLWIELGKLMTFGVEFTDADVIGRALVHDAKAAEAMGDAKLLLQRESALVSYEATFPDHRTPSDVPPTLVLGGEADAFVPVSDFRYEADSWKGELVLLPGVSHGVMLDACWRDVADKVIGWLRRVSAA